MSTSERTFDANDLVALGWDAEAADAAAKTMRTLAQALEPLAAEDAALSSSRVVVEEPLTGSTGSVISVRYSTDWGKDEG